MFFNRWIVGAAALAWFSACGAGWVSKAATIETEEDEDIAAPQTPTPEKTGMTEQSTPAITPAEEKSTPRTRISDSIGFFYFVQSGYLVNSPSRVPEIGKVWGSSSDLPNYSTPQKFYVELSSKGKVNAGDLLVVYRV